MTSYLANPSIKRVSVFGALLLHALTVAPPQSHAAPPPPGVAECTSDGGLQQFPEMAPLPAVPSTYAGFVSGSFSVGDAGDAQYSVPIEVAPGRTDALTPELSIAYSSDSGAGPLGVGFGLRVGRAIERCGSHQLTDGSNRPVRLDAEDHFCFEGARLKQVATFSDGAFTAREFRTYPAESFARIIGYFPPNGATPHHFTVWDASGLISDYGASDDSRVLLGAGAVAGKWLQNETRDRFGNAMHIEYEQTRNAAQSTRSIRPKRIEYGAHASSQSPHSRSVVFEYEHLPYWYGATAFTFGEPMAPSNEALLTHVKSYVGNQLYRDHELTYLPTISRHAVLTRIDVCEASGACRVPIKLLWDGIPDGQPRKAEIEPLGLQWASPLAPIPAASQIGDFNGDGLPDIVIATKNPDSDDWSFVVRPHAWANADYANAPLAAMYDEPAVWATVKLEGVTGVEKHGLRLEVLDIDDDGRADLIASHPHESFWGQRFVLRSTGTGFTPVLASGIANPAVHRGAFEPVDQSDFLLADLNGDGKADLVECVEPVATATDPLYTEDNCSDPDDLQIAQVIDIPGRCVRSRAEWSVRFWTPGDQLNSPKVAIPALNGFVCRLISEQGVNVVDYDGDGQSELVYLADNAGSVRWKTLQLDLSSGAWGGRELVGATPPVVAADHLHHPIGAATSGPRVVLDAIYFPDLNGDGLRDFLYVNTGGTRAIYATGIDTSFVQHDNLYPRPSYVTGTGTGFDAAEPWTWLKTGVQIADVNGDGRDDVLVRRTMFEGPMWTASVFPTRFDAYLSNDVGELSTAQPDFIQERGNVSCGALTHEECTPICHYNTVCDANGENCQQVEVCEAPTCVIVQDGVSCASALSGLMVADFDGDGRADLLAPTDGAKDTVHLSRTPRILLAGVWTGANALEGPTSYADWRHKSNDGDPGFFPDLVIGYDDLLWRTRNVPAFDVSTSPHLTYVAQADPGNDCTYPRGCFQSNKMVVSEYRTVDARQQWLWRKVSYRDGRFDRRGHGFIGFGSRIEMDSKPIGEDPRSTGQTTVTYYDNRTQDPTFKVYPYAGAPSRSLSYVPSAPTDPNPYRVDVSVAHGSRAVMPLNGGLNYTVVTASSTRETRVRFTTTPESGSNSAGLWPLFGEMTDPTTPMIVLSASHTVDSEFDDQGRWGRRVSWVDDVDEETVSTRAIKDDKASWLLGLVQREDVCSTAAGRTECGAQERDHQPGTGVVKELRRAPDEPSAFLRVQYGHDAFGHLTKVHAEDAFGHVRESCVGYDPSNMFPYVEVNGLGHKGRVIADPMSGRPLSQRDANGRMTKLRYDTFGELVEARSPDGVITTSSAVRAKQGGPGNHYELVSQVQSNVGPTKVVKTDMSGKRSLEWISTSGVSVEDSVGVMHPSSTMLAMEYEYDTRGRLIFQSRPHVDGDVNAMGIGTSRTYDNQGRVVTEKAPGQPATVYSYGLFTVTKQTPGTEDFGAPSTTTVHDPAGRVISVESPDGMMTYAHGPFGRVERVTGVDGTVTLLEHDAYGRLEWRSDPDRGAVTMTYDGFDEVAASIDALNRTTTFVNDALGRRVSMTNGDGTTTFEYDTAPKGATQQTVLGALARVTGPESARALGYDDLARPTSMTLQYHDGSVATSTRVLDPYGRTEKLLYPAGQGKAGTPFTVQYEYAADGRLLRVFDAGTPATTYWKKNSIDAAGHTIVEERGAGVLTHRAYNVHTGVLERIHTTRVASKLTSDVQNHAYIYDDRTNVRARVDFMQPTMRSEFFRYDASDRLTCAYFKACKPSEPACALEASPTCDLGVSYAAGGNIAAKSDMGEYRYDPARPHAVREIVNGLNAGQYAYDAAGNQISRPGVLDIGYNGFDLPTFYQVQSDVFVYFKYDDRGRRIYKQTPEERTWYFDGLFERHAKDGVEELRYYVSNGEATVAIVTERSDQATAAHRLMFGDNLGSTHVVTNLAGNDAEARRSHDAFGASRSPVWGQPAPVSQSTISNRGFTGHELDHEVGLVNAGGRIYDPKLGRFLQADPVVTDARNAQTWNPYSYVRNNPLKYTDPSGFSEVPTAPLSEANNAVLGFAVSNAGLGGALYVLAHNAANQPNLQDGPQLSLAKSVLPDASPGQQAPSSGPANVLIRDNPYDAGAGGTGGAPGYDPTDPDAGYQLAGSSPTPPVGFAAGIIGARNAVRGWLDGLGWNKASEEAYQRRTRPEGGPVRPHLVIGTTTDGLMKQTPGAAVNAMTIMAMVRFHATSLAQAPKATSAPAESSGTPAASPKPRGPEPDPEITVKELHGPYTHMINKGGLDKIIEEQQMLAGESNFGDTSVRGTLYKLHPMQDGKFPNIEFYTEEMPHNVNWKNSNVYWYRPGGGRLDILLTRIAEPDGTIVDFYPPD